MLMMSQLCGFGAAQVPSGGDVVPDAINITNISGTDAVQSNSVTISGINQAITIRAAFSSVGGLATSMIYLFRNGVIVDSDSPITNGGAIEGAFVAGDVLQFEVEVSGAPGQSRSGTVTLTNQSDAGTVIDTFTFGVTCS